MKNIVENEAANAQILKAVAHMTDTQSPAQMKETLHEILIQWLLDAQNIETNQKDRFVEFYKETRYFLIELEKVAVGE
jgi:hypothetical protein